MRPIAVSLWKEHTGQDSVPFSVSVHLKLNQRLGLEWKGVGREEEGWEGEGSWEEGGRYEVHITTVTLQCRGYEALVTSVGS